MAKKKKSKKKAEKSKVVCFFFYGDIDELGAQLAVFADDSQTVAAVTEWVKSVAPVK